MNYTMCHMLKAYLHQTVPCPQTSKTTLFMFFSCSQLHITHKTTGSIKGNPCIYQGMPQEMPYRNPALLYILAQAVQSIGTIPFTLDANIPILPVIFELRSVIGNFNGICCFGIVS